MYVWNERKMKPSFNSSPSISFQSYHWIPFLSITFLKFLWFLWYNVFCSARRHSRIVFRMMFRIAVNRLLSTPLPVTAAFSTLYAHILQNSCKMAPQNSYFWHKTCQKSSNLVNVLIVTWIVTIQCKSGIFIELYLYFW